MKQTMQFRLFPETTHLIEQIADTLHVNKTWVVEHAIVEFAKHHHPQHSLLKYAGILNDTEADEMLTVIKQTKNNKKNWVEPG